MALMPSSLEGPSRGALRLDTRVGNRKLATAKEILT
jgi:hypothetical protein